MPWTVQRVWDQHISCMSTHSTEAMALADVGRHLGALTEFLGFQQAEMRQRGFGRVPGFLEDVETTLDRMGELLSSDQVWKAYDVWATFMTRWEDSFDLPLWVSIGDVVVKGPGPTVKRALYPLLRAKVKDGPILGAGEEGAGWTVEQHGDLKLSYKPPSGSSTLGFLLVHDGPYSQLDAIFGMAPDLAADIQHRDESTAACIAEHPGHAGWIENLRVAQDTRGAGMGSRMIDVALQTFRSLGIRYAWLIATSEAGRMPDLLRFYSRHGFNIAPGCHGSNGLTLMVRL